MDFSYTETQDMLRDTLARFLADTYDFETRKKMLSRPEGTIQGYGARWRPNSAFWARPLPKSMAGWAAARSKT